MTGYDDGGRAVPVAMPAHDEFGEIVGIVRSWRVEDRQQLASELGIAADAGTEALRRAFEAGHREGRADGMRELLARLCSKASSVVEIGERAAVAAVAEAVPDAPAGTIRELARFTGLATGSAWNRVADYRAENERT